jgi:hypothetical protein
MEVDSGIFEVESQLQVQQPIQVEGPLVYRQMLRQPDTKRGVDEAAAAIRSGYGSIFPLVNHNQRFTHPLLIFINRAINVVEGPYSFDGTNDPFIMTASRVRSQVDWDYSAKITAGRLVDTVEPASWGQHPITVNHSSGLWSAVPFLPPAA